jgi:HPt (histidine-containing phosphotransfer) domain-containing protein
VDPEFSDIDRQTAEDLFADFSAHHSHAERAIAELLILPSDGALHQLFREVHTIKGNAAMFAFSEIVHFIHAVENIISALRTGTLQMTKPLGEVIMMSLDRAKDLYEVRLFKRSIDHLDISNVQVSLNQVAAARNEKAADLAVTHAINQLTNDFVEPYAQGDEPLKTPDYFNSDLAIKQDLIFFRSLALQMDKQNVFWDQRSALIFRWSQKMNALADYPVDPSQLAAAVYLHDVGMSFLPSDIVNKTGKLSALESQQLQHHPAWGMEFVRRMSQWQEAALIIGQHHERMDGKGYPEGIMGQNIHTGARLIAILDAFYAIIHSRADRALRRSVLRAVSEINACAGSQFCPTWVNFFNQVIRVESREGLLGQGA